MARRRLYGGLLLLLALATHRALLPLPRLTHAPPTVQPHAEFPTEPWHDPQPPTRPAVHHNSPPAVRWPRILVDYTHHNPGDPHGLYDSAMAVDFHSLKAMGYSHWMGRYVNLAVTLAAVPHPDPNASGWFPAPGARAWVDALGASITAQVRAAKTVGLGVLYQIDLTVLPTHLAEVFQDELREGALPIGWGSRKTLEVVQAMVDEIFARWPEVDGLVTRTGENYLMDTPWHTGAGPIDVWGAAIPEQVAQYVHIVSQLRAMVCERHQRLLVFRTWDTLIDRLHGNPLVYLPVAKGVRPHPNLVFSIKHTRLDYWRYTAFNPNIGTGPHGQIVEVQCAREYEGKGAFPNYIAHGVIAGFPEQPKVKGLAHVLASPVVRGLFTWSRGGGWGGPYPKCGTLWPSLNAWVLARWFARANASAGAAELVALEAAVFEEYCADRLGLGPVDAAVFRAVALLSSEAVLHGRYFGPFDSVAIRDHDVACPPARTQYPSCNWLRDDTLGGLEQMQHVWAWLSRHRRLEEALAEKRRAMELWRSLEAQARNVTFRDAVLQRHFQTGATYGVLLHTAISAALHVMAECASEPPNTTAVHAGHAVLEYVQAKSRLQALSIAEPCLATLPSYTYGASRDPGMDASVARCAGVWLRRVDRRGPAADVAIARRVLRVPFHLLPLPFVPTGALRAAGAGAVSPLPDGCGWQQTGGCRPEGPREPQHDEPCRTVVPAGRSGYCLCPYGLKAALSPCQHSELVCFDECVKALAAAGVSPPADFGFPIASEGRAA
eukprot:EG_transcript_3561